PPRRRTLDLSFRRRRCSPGVNGIAVVGSGYLGTVVAACFSVLGYTVTGVEHDELRLEALGNGRAAGHEPGLEELLGAGRASGRLSFTDSIVDAMDRSDVAFLCVEAPGTRSGRPD